MLRFYPQALDAFEPLKTHFSLRFLRAFPAPAALKALTYEQFAAFCEITTLLLPDLSSLEVLSSSALSEPGPLPANTVLSYHRNEEFVGWETELLQIASALAEVLENGR